MSESPQPQSAQGRTDDFHRRAGQSHAEARKLVTGMAVGSFGVLYATLTGDSAPTLDACNRALAILAIVAMASSAGFGLAAWRADAAWAYRAAENFLKNPARIAPDGGRWHHVKKSCDISQLTLFGIGLLVATVLTFRLLR